MADSSDPSKNPVTGIITSTVGAGITSQKIDFSDLDSCTNAGKTLISSSILVAEVGCFDTHGHNLNMIQRAESRSDPTAKVIQSKF